MANGSSCGRAWARNISTRRTKILLYFGDCFCSEKYSWNSLLFSFVQCRWHWRVLRRSFFFLNFIYNSISCTKQCLFSSLHSTVHSLQSAQGTWWSTIFFEIVRDCDFVFQNIRKHVQHFVDLGLIRSMQSVWVSRWVSPPIIITFLPHLKLLSFASSSASETTAKKKNDFFI